MAIFETGLSAPNQLLKIGASAMIGMALMAIATGSSALLKLAKRDETIPVRMPAPQPRTKPQKAFWKVTQPAEISLG